MRVVQGLRAESAEPVTIHGPVVVFRWDNPDDTLRPSSFTPDLLSVGEAPFIPVEDGR